MRNSYYTMPRLRVLRLATQLVTASAPYSAISAMSSTWGQHRH